MQSRAFGQKRFLALDDIICNGYEAILLKCQLLRIFENCGQSQSSEARA
jgi:hypothetical protein